MPYVNQFATRYDSGQPATDAGLFLMRKPSGKCVNKSAVPRIHYKKAKLVSQEGPEALLRYLNYISEIIYTPHLIVVNPGWFGLRVLGNIISSFEGAEQLPSDWAGAVGCVKSCFSHQQARKGLYHDGHGRVAEKEIKQRIITSLEFPIEPEKLLGIAY
ncbi:hypothetical protein Mapa_001629 [Marchantia paleacea]|nr:hypothetical protein Mapa_001629 [Marchantia paleacea]